MGRKGSEQTLLFIPHDAVAKAPGHRFYERLNDLLKEHGFDGFVEQLCEAYYASEAKQGRRSIPPGIYFRMLLVGYFEGIESERGICWRCEDSLSLRSFLGLNFENRVPDHSSLSRIRTRLDGEVYEEVFRFILSIVEQAGLLKGRVVGVDSTYLRADASMKAIIRRDTKESHQDYLLRLAKEEGIEDPNAEDARRLDRKRKKKTSNKEWKSETDAEARIARLKDGRTRLAYKPELAVDLETGAILAAPIHPADEGDTQTVTSTLEAARTNVLTAAEAAGVEDGDEDDDRSTGTGTGNSDCNEAASQDRKVDFVGDKGYYSDAVLEELEDRGFRPYIPEPKRNNPRRWSNKPDGEARQRRANNARRRGRSGRGRSLQRKRGEMLERPFAHLLETGAHRRTRLRGRANVAKRFTIHAAAANLGLVMRSRYGFGTPRGLAAAAAAAALFSLGIALGLVPVIRAIMTSVTRCRTLNFELIAQPSMDAQMTLCSTGC